MEVPCVQINMNKATAATTSLVEMIVENDFVVFASEPYTAYGKVVSMPRGYKVMHAKPQVGQTIRAALVIPEILNPIFLEHLSHVDCAVAMIKHDDRNIVLVSAYLDANIPIPSQDFLDLVMEYCDDNDTGVVLGMDSNAHSDLFSEVDSDERGCDLEDFILRNSLVVVNEGNIPTFETVRANSIIDVTLVRGATVSNWYVSREYNASDHNSIFFDIIADVEPPTKFRPWLSANWDLFKTKLDIEYVVPEFMTVKKLEKSVSFLYKKLYEALDVACPIILKQPRLRGNIWLTPYLKKLHRRVQVLYKRKIRTNVATDISAY